jgi:tetratricopeptide (TPR) repeat protein
MCLVVFVSFVNAGFDKNAIFIQADALFTNKYYEEAIKLYQQIIDNDAEDVNAIVKLGYCYFYTSKKEKAAEMFEKAYKLTGKDSYKQLVEISSKQTEKADKILVDKNSFKDFYFGIKAGASCPQSNSIYAFIPRIGIVGGFDADYYLIHNILALQLEINYLIINTSLQMDEWDDSSFVIYNTWDSFQIPLLIKASLPLNGAIRPFITFGPAIETQRTLSSWPSYTQYNLLPARGSLIVGIGTDYILGNGNLLSIEARADWIMCGDLNAGINPYTVYTVMLGYSI